VLEERREATSKGGKRERLGERRENGRRASKQSGLDQSSAAYTLA